MGDNIKSTIKSVAHLLNDYVKTKDIDKIEEIENYFKDLFSANIVNFWKYDKRSDEISLLKDEKFEKIFLESSFMKQAIDAKSPLIVNHITSDKYYAAEIDNPLDLKVKALLLFPIIKGRAVIGVIKIWRGIKQRKVFTKQDEKILENFSSLLVNLIEFKSIEKEELMALTGEKIQKKSIPVKAKENKPSVTQVSKDKSKVNKTEDDLEALKKKFEQTIIDHKSLELSWKKELEGHKSLELSWEKELEGHKSLELSWKKELEGHNKSEENLNTEIKKYKNNLENVEDKYTTLETSSEELYSDIQKSQIRIKELEDNLKTVNEDNKAFKNELKEKKKEKKVKSIKELKSEKSLQNYKDSSKLGDNLEYILQEVYEQFGENEDTYILFEVMIYALYSKKGISTIEEIINKSKLVPTLIEEYYFNGDIDIHNEKCIILDFVNSFKSYETKIFMKNPELNILVDKDVPKSLVFDAPKMKSISFHLLMDMYQFIDHSKPIDISLVFKNKYLIIELCGSVHQENSLFKSMFKQTKLSNNEKDRHGLQLSRKLIKSLKGEIETVFKDKSYKFVLTLPTQVIKM